MRIMIFNPVVNSMGTTRNPPEEMVHMDTVIDSYRVYPMHIRINVITMVSMK